MGLKEIFEKQGGKKLLAQYFQSGAIFIALSEFLLLGKERTALEILRLSAQTKAKQKLRKKYISKLKDFDLAYNTQISHNNSNKVWICWFQGIENAPAIVKKCYESIKKNLTDRELILITFDNIDQYVQFPDYIINKWKSGKITHTHMTDLLRLELLIKYGGLWLDSTVLCSDKREIIPDYYFNSDLFFFQSLKPGRDGHCIYMSSWLMSAKTNNRILMATRCLLYEYWKKNDKMIDYFLLHIFMSIVLDYYKQDWDNIIPCDNGMPHALLLRLFEPYNDCIWKAIKNQISFHKLTYKFTEEQVAQENTYYDVILRSYE